MGVPAGIALISYLSFNYWYAGSFMPTSGLAKGGGALIQNAYVTAVTLFSPTFDIREWLGNYSGNRAAILQASFRVIELLIPAALCFGVLVTRAWKQQPYFFFIFAICTGTILKASYNIIFVHYWHQSVWYYATEFCIFNILAALLFRGPISHASPVTTRALGAAYLLFYLLSFSKIYSERLLGPGENAFLFWKDRATIEQAILADNPNNRIIEIDDGIVNFTLKKIPTMHGFMFAADLEALRAFQANALLTLAFKRGFNVIGSFAYMPWDSSINSSDAIRGYLRNSLLDARLKAELDKFDFQLIYVYGPTKSPFIKLLAKKSNS